MSPTTDLWDTNIPGTSIGSHFDGHQISLFRTHVIYIDRWNIESAAVAIIKRSTVFQVKADKF